jgi:hypothetical protein
VAYSPTTVSATTTRFEQAVRSKLIENKLANVKPDSLRSLAREMAGGDQGRTETYKRSLFKWMASGEPSPSPASRALVARALGIDPTELEEDEEESDPVAELRKVLDHAVELAAAMERRGTTERAA